MQQNNGTIGLTVGSNAIVGVGTTFTQDAKIGNFIYVYGLNQVFRIAKITSDTALSVAQPPTGKSGLGISNLVYAICDHFSPTLGLPLPTANQVSVQTTAINRAWAILDREIPNPT